LGDTPRDRDMKPKMHSIMLMLSPSPSIDPHPTPKLTSMTSSFCYVLLQCIAYEGAENLEDIYTSGLHSVLSEK